MQQSALGIKEGVGQLAQLEIARSRHHRFITSSCRGASVRPSPQDADKHPGRL